MPFATFPIGANFTVRFEFLVLIFARKMLTCHSLRSRCIAWAALLDMTRLPVLQKVSDDILPKPYRVQFIAFACFAVKDVTTDQTNFLALWKRV